MSDPVLDEGQDAPEPDAPRRLVLLRHAKAEAYAESDEARPLALRGRRQAVGVGAALAEVGLVPDLALVSAAVRTRQTWELLASRLPGEPEVRITRDLYDAGTRGVLALVHEVPDDVATLLVVGHEPVMSSLAAYLAGPESDRALLQSVQLGVGTATRCVLEVPGGWAALGRAGARLVAVERSPED